MAVVVVVSFVGGGDDAAAAVVSLKNNIHIPLNIIIIDYLWHPVS